MNIVPFNQQQANDYRAFRKLSPVKNRQLLADLCPS